MGNHPAWHTEQCNPTVVTALPPIPFSLLDRDEQFPFSFWRNGTRLTNGSQKCMQPIGHGRASLKQLCLDITNTSCLSTPEPQHSISPISSRVFFPMGRPTFTICNSASRSCMSEELTVVGLLKNSVQRALYPFLSDTEATFHCSDSTYLRGGHGAELL